MGALRHDRSVDPQSISCHSGLTVRVYRLITRRTRAPRVPSDGGDEMTEEEIVFLESEINHQYQWYNRGVQTMERYSPNGR